jgi:hypothetical protein
MWTLVTEDGRVPPFARDGFCMAICKPFIHSGTKLRAHLVLAETMKWSVQSKDKCLAKPALPLKVKAVFERVEEQRKHQRGGNPAEQSPDRGTL